MAIIREKNYDPYLLFQEGDTAYICYGHGYSKILPKEETLQFIRRLNNFLNKYSDEDIEKHNKKVQEDFEKMINGYDRNPEPKPKVKGSIYLLECKGRYKIGASKNVDRRVKQLDKRPFKVTKIISKDNVEDYYDKEKELHVKYSKNEIEGEWFIFTPEELKKVIEDIKRL